MKIYTRTGDDGSTGLVGGQRTRKSDPRIECYGTVDELNASIGWAAAAAGAELAAALREVQGELFAIGAHLATPEGTPRAASLPALDEAWAARLESQIDAAEAVLPPLRQFILPGGAEPAARLHLARTVCRRAERLLVAFAADRPVDPVILTYFNRLSDWLFVQARRANHLAGVADVPWVKK
jgi:cob(I)alamin adenosyltransferase